MDALLKQDDPGKYTFHHAACIIFILAVPWISCQGCIGFVLPRAVLCIPRGHRICTLEYPERFNGYSLVSEHIMVQSMHVPPLYNYRNHACESDIIIILIRSCMFDII